jgi:SNF2 family DNA or RNA helicase
VIVVESCIGDTGLSRAHRISQEKRVFVYRYISVSTIEERYSVFRRKSKLAETFIESSNPFATS